MTTCSSTVVPHGPRHEPRLVEAPLGERLRAFDGDVAHDLEPRGGCREVDERQRIAVHVAHPSDLVRGLDLERHFHDPQIVAFARP